MMMYSNVLEMVGFYPAKSERDRWDADRKMQGQYCHVPAPYPYHDDESKLIRLN
jgi:hypothetical protein